MTRAVATPSGAAAAFWGLDVDEVLTRVDSGVDGLSQRQAAQRLARDGPNRLEPGRGHRGARLLLAQFTSPIILILVAATILSIALGDLVDGVIILIIIVASGLLGFFQEHSAGRAVDALLARVQVEVEVLRDGQETSVPAEDIVVGDIVVLRAGDIIPADCRIIESHNLLVDEAALTGESYPAEKSSTTVAPEAALAGRADAVFLGTHVASGAATAVVVAVGRATEFGAVSAAISGRGVTTRFERGITAFGLLLVRAMVVLVTAIFAINLALQRPVVESLLFSLALAVGLTPQLLPAIVAVSLSTGARRMAREKVIVKRLDAIEDFGAMTVLCTDKTGTLTAGSVSLDAGLDVDGHTSADVLRLARLNAGLQQGFTNPLDEAVLHGAPPLDAARLDGTRLDEVPYDFQRKMLSVLVELDGVPTLVTKGAFASVVSACATAERSGAVVPLPTVRQVVEHRYEQLCGDGYRVLAVATRALPGHRRVTAADETEMTLRGLLAFRDPTKPGVVEALRELDDLGISVRLVTGDNRIVAREVATAAGLVVDTVLTGAEIDRLDDERLAQAAGSTSVFAEVEPLHKERIVRSFRATGEVVGFLGDGINDAPALGAADVGMSVDSAVDVAKQSASIVLLDKSLAVVADGVRLGRQTFANTLKYVRVTTSANFGNMLSMAAAAAFLPFLPLLPRQILLLNFLSDIPGMTIAADAVDPEQLERPRAWDIRAIRRFMIVFGLVSSAFDILTFVALRAGFGAGAALFRSGWFVESTATELAVMLVLRTSRPFYRSRPGRALLTSSILVGAFTVTLPYTALADPLGLVPLPAGVLAALLALTTVYVGANELAKRHFLREA